jgi:tRNA (cmo5U34)-methyltransferase
MSSPNAPDDDRLGRFGPRRAEDYDERILQVVPGYAVLHDLVGLLLGAAVPEDSHVLVVGVGTGKELAVLGRARPARRFTAVDPSPEMLAKAETLIERENLAQRVTLVSGYVDELPASVRFDAATLLLVMHFLPDDRGAERGGKAGLLEALARRLKPGAPLILADACGDPATPAFKRLLAASRAWKILTGMTPEEEEEGYQRIIKTIPFVTEARIHELLAEAGFGAPEMFFRSLMFGAWIAWRE